MSPSRSLYKEMGGASDKFLSGFPQKMENKLLSGEEKRSVGVGVEFRTTLNNAKASSSSSGGCLRNSTVKLSRVGLSKIAFSSIYLGCQSSLFYHVVLFGRRTPFLNPVSFLNQTVMLE